MLIEINYDQVLNKKKFQVLSNADKRRIYDQGGDQAIKEGGSGGGGGVHSPMDVFDMFFGGGEGFGGRRQRGPRYDSLSDLIKFSKIIYFYKLKKLYQTHFEF